MLRFDRVTTTTTPPNLWSCAPCGGGTDESPRLTDLNREENGNQRLHRRSLCIFGSTFGIAQTIARASSIRVRSIRYGCRKWSMRENDLFG
mmetsp:Transcript_49568/g.73716  ORF Transcript_49568/g.73716 Transcript_49568/m.73716 type:complete len:91 (+) Transcript_49568:1363-1635(+)